MTALKKVIKMETLRKYLSYVLCLCVSSYALPVFAGGPAIDEVATRVELTDEAMNQAIGASGNVDATMADYTKAGSAASAVIANRSTVGVNYSLDVVNSDGVVLENLSAGSMNSGVAMIIGGTPTIAQNKYVQARVWNAGVPGLESKDSSWAP